MLSAPVKNFCKGKLSFFIWNHLPRQNCWIHNNRNNLSTSSKNSYVNQLKKYWLFYYTNYITNYSRVIALHFPKTVHAYRIFRIGTNKLYHDMKSYIIIRKKFKVYGHNSLNRAELQLSFTFPKDLVKITPILLLSAIPFTNYIIFPLALYFPCFILTSHYWSMQEKIYFITKNHKKKLQYNKLLLRNMQRQINVVKESVVQTKLKVVIAHLGSGTHPSISDILYCKRLFSGFPFSLQHMERKHCRELLKVHGMNPFSLRIRNLLMERGLLIKRMDMAIQLEGGVKTLSYEDLRWALSFRGINAANISIDSMQTWLDYWLLISSEIDSDSISLLLHCPILLAYNQETNWTLLFHKKEALIGIFNF